MGLIGRDSDVLSIQTFFDGVGVSGGALLLVGEAGVGKTAVIDEFAAGEEARGTRVLRADGAQFESDVSYSSLNQLLLPLAEDMAALSEDHRTALRCALGFEVGPVPSRLLVSNAVFRWLRTVAADRPLAIVVDDVHWLDRASAEVFGFIARRLAGSSIAFLAACRPTERGLFAGYQLSELPLQPLPDPMARALLDLRFPSLSPAVRQRVVTEAAGNPLALLELPTALAGDQRADFTTLPAVLPLPERLQALFASRIHALPQRCRLMLLLGALGGTSDLTRLRAAGGTTCDLDDLAPAVEDRLVHLSSNRLTFRHPLIAAAVVEASTDGDRRWAHRSLAHSVGDLDRRARHLAESTTEPDAEVAAELAAAAQSLSSRGDAIGAVVVLIRAAELSPDPVDRSHRLAEAAYIGAEAAGELTAAARLLDDARRSGYLSTHSLPAAAATAYLLINSDGDVVTAHRLLAAAIQAGDHEFDASQSVLIEALYTMFLISCWVGTAEAWQIYHDLISRLRPEPPPVLWVTTRLLGDPARATDADLRLLDELIAEAIAGDDPNHLIRVGSAAVFTDRLYQLRGPERNLADWGRKGEGPARHNLTGLMHLATEALHSGQWDEAMLLADEAIRVCSELGLLFFDWYFRYVHSMVAGGRGQATAARQLTDDITRWAVAGHALGVTEYALQARAFTDVGAGDYESAYQHAARLSPPGELAPNRPTALWSAFDLVEACLRTGRRDEAAAHAKAMRASGLPRISPRFAMLTAAASALTSDDEPARNLFDMALSISGTQQWPFDVARVRLAYGQHLRRIRSASDARAHLTAAYETFDGLGAVSWRERAAAELGASGLTRQPSVEALAQLTPQERKIAELAGAGLSNKQIGEQLFLSHRTVGDHLYKIFPKLGITKRAALRDALAAYDRRE